MPKPTQLSTRTRINWLIDAAVFCGALVASLSGAHLLLDPGGRSLMRGVHVFFSRANWHNLHTWGGVVMIAAAMIHFAFHWKWVKTMGKRVLKAPFTRSLGLSKGAKVNLLVDAVIAASFLLTATSGLYFLLLTSGGYQGGRNPDWDPGFLLDRATWDTIHACSGVVLIAAAVVHFYIHWRWIKNVTAKFFRSLFPPGGSTVDETI